MTVRYAPGEQMRTEISKKFSRDGLSRELDAAGFDLMHWWTDPAERFVLSLATRR
jgi:L-histidine N-alpha-methyltransferase